MADKLHNKSNDPKIEERLEEILDLLYSFYDQTIDMSLERVERFLQQLGNPHLKLPPVIHVAGTNGKGSTIAALRSLLESTGKTVHVFTSPHLVHPTERIRLAGIPITTKALIKALEECLAVNRAEPITFFEIFTAAGFLIMSRTPADYVLLETGMGGRLDATNVVPNPICTIITTISKDHEKFLGGTLKDIAFEKAGIIKAGVPCVIGYQTPQAVDAGVMDVIHDVSTSLSPDASLYRYGSEWQSDTVQTGMKFNWAGKTTLTNRPNLLGQHQIYNAGAALAAYRVIMGHDYDAKILSPDNAKDTPVSPLRKIFWPGRLQKLEGHAYHKLISEGSELWLDGGHNDSAGQFLADQAAQWQNEDNKPLHLIIAMVNRKTPAEFLSPLLPFAASITTTQIEGENSSFSPQELHDLIKPLNPPNLSHTSTIEEALENLPQTPQGRILIAGSLYLLGNIL